MFTYRPIKYKCINRAELKSTMLKYPTFQTIGTKTFHYIHTSEDTRNIVLTYNILIVRSRSYHYLFHLFSCLFSKIMIIKPGIKGIQFFSIAVNIFINRQVVFFSYSAIAFMISQVALQLLFSNFSLYFSLHFLIPSLSSFCGLFNLALSPELKVTLFLVMMSFTSFVIYGLLFG